MQPDSRFLGQPKSFWANVRTVSQKHGYATKASGVKVPSLADLVTVYDALGLTWDHVTYDGRPTEFGQLLLDYFQFRADVLNDRVKQLLMDVDDARELYDLTFARLQPRCSIPMNKQSGEKKAPAFLTGLVNMLVESGVADLDCDYDPRELTTVTRDGVPVRTLARRVDGAFPSPVNPIALWEIKEYYYTTTFGSRVADGVYETLLDGMELEELREHEGIDVKHYLFIDSYNTWWNDGKSYLCRMIDMMHMGYVDEVIFGREVVDRVPALTENWVRLWMEHSPTIAEDRGVGH